MALAIYLTYLHDPDPAIVRGLRASGCDVVQTRTVKETMALIEATSGASTQIVLVSELQAGALTLLKLLKESRGRYVDSKPGARSSFPPPTLIFDHEGNDIGTAIMAMQLGACDYLLVKNTDAERELAARLLAERIQVADPKTNASAIQAAPDRPQGPVASDVLIGREKQLAFEWEPANNIIRCGGTIIRISRTEGRIFNQLVRDLGKVVSVPALIEHALLNAGGDFEAGEERLRVHITKLRRKLDACPAMANRIVNVRGTGYLLL